MRTVRIFVWTELFLLLPIFLMGGEKPTVELAGLQIVGPGYGLNGSELRAFHEQSGTTLSLAMTIPGGKQIVDIDDSKCSLTEFTDDRGQNLLDGIDWGSFPKISEDAHSAMVEVSSKNRPSKDASRLSVKGSIHLRVAASESTEKIDNLKLEVSAKAKIQQEVIQVMKVQLENDGLTLVLQINRKFVDNMKDIRFYTVEGNPIDIWSQGSFTFGTVSQMEYALDSKTIPETLKVELDMWQDLESIDLPFELKSGLGL